MWIFILLLLCNITEVIMFNYFINIKFPIFVMNIDWEICFAVRPAQLCIILDVWSHPWRMSQKMIGCVVCAELTRYRT